MVLRKEPNNNNTVGQKKNRGMIDVMLVYMIVFKLCICTYVNTIHSVKCGNQNTGYLNKILYPQLLINICWNEKSVRRQCARIISLSLSLILFWPQNQNSGPPKNSKNSRKNLKKSGDPRGILRDPQQTIKGPAHRKF